MAVTYMTEEGLKKLKEELQFLETVERPRIIAAIAEAREKGDLSENAEYDAARAAEISADGCTRAEHRGSRYRRGQTPDQGARPSEKYRHGENIPTGNRRRSEYRRGKDLYLYSDSERLAGQKSRRCGADPGAGRSAGVRDPRDQPLNK